MSQDPELRAHQEWLGYLQPVGLVASPAALRDAQAHVNKNIIREQSILIQHVLRESIEATKRGEEWEPRLKDFAAFARDFWQWEPSDLSGGPGGPELPTTLEVPLPEYGEVLVPTYAIPDSGSADSWLMLIKVRTDNAALDDAPDETQHEKRWQASPQARFERLLRANQVPIGLLVTPHVIRLVYCPRGESTGHLTFPFKAMCEVAGRPIVAALHLLLEAGRLFFLPTNQRLPWILQQSRKYQNEVSTKLAEQVLRALNELMRGFQSANEATNGDLLCQVLRDAPDEVYGGLLTTLLRMVFILYAEDRSLLSNDPVYLGSYSLSGLFERLREDDAQYPDTMDQRFGAWTQFLTLCRLIYDGGGHGAMNLPPRHGRLFDPDVYPFLEGRPFRSKRSSIEANMPPRVSDGVMFRILQDLLVLDGDRLSYRSLDVEQIGSVYEAMMGFEVRTAQGISIGLRPDHVVVNLRKILDKSLEDRARLLKDDTGCDLSGKALEQLKSAKSIEDVVSALGKRISHLYLDQRGMPMLVAAAGMYLQPTAERRRSGSHYTPRSLTEPIVRTTLEPVLKELGENPRPEQIIDLKVCDPAMGSGAFLVEACRFLAEALVEAWSLHGETPIMPPDQDPILHARRLIAQRCLYGVDKNPFAVDLSKLSLWLATLAKDHPFTFLDHSLRCGDSLVGLTRQQIAAFNWVPAGQQSFLEQELIKRIERVSDFRQRIVLARDEVPYEQLHQQLDRADDAIFPLRQAGDVVIGAFFSADKPRTRDLRRAELQAHVEAAFRHQGQFMHEEPIEAAIRTLSKSSLAPFHWELEFPEVFGTGRDGFDCIVGNPPFLGGSQLSELLGGPEYQEWLKAVNKDAFGNADLCAYFFRRAYSLISKRGTFGLLATKTISEGGSRISGLLAILASGGRIYNAIRTQEWPGEAAVLVVVVHIAAENAHLFEDPVLDGEHVSFINSRLHASPEVADPVPLSANKEKGFFGTKIGGVGFILSPEEHTRLAEKPHNRQCLMPFLGGEEVNTSPVQSHDRYAINFGSESLEYAQQFPELIEIVRTQVKPERDRALDHGPGKHGKKYWWQFVLRADPLHKSIANSPRCIVTAITTTHLAFSFQPIRQVFSGSIVVLAFDSFAAFACLQSSVHNFWAFRFSSYMKEALRYSVSDAFQTFPLCKNLSNDPRLEAAGREYYEFRAALMRDLWLGFTEIYNLFHSPGDEALVRLETLYSKRSANSNWRTLERVPSDRSPLTVYDAPAAALAGIQQLRNLHAAMDTAVLTTYGWTDLLPQCTYEFLFDYVDDEAEYGVEGFVGRKKKKPHRYRWPNELRDIVIARLLQLNRQRVEEERLAGVANENLKSRKRTPKAAGNSGTTSPTLFSPENLTK